MPYSDQKQQPKPQQSQPQKQQKRNFIQSQRATQSQKVQQLPKISVEKLKQILSNDTPLAIENMPLKTTDILWGIRKEHFNWSLERYLTVDDLEIIDFYQSQKDGWLFINLLDDRIAIRQKQTYEFPQYLSKMEINKSFRYKVQYLIYRFLQSKPAFRKQSILKPMDTPKSFSLMVTIRVGQNNAATYITPRLLYQLQGSNYEFAFDVKENSSGNVEIQCADSSKGTYRCVNRQK